MTRWEIRRVPTGDTDRMARTVDEGREPFNVLGENIPAEVWFRRPTDKPGLARAWVSDAGMFQGVEVRT